MVIQGDSLSQLPVGVTVARKTVGIARENIIFAIAVQTADHSWLRCRHF